MMKHLSDLMPVKTRKNRGRLKEADRRFTASVTGGTGSQS